MNNHRLQKRSICLLAVWLSSVFVGALPIGVLAIEWPQEITAEEGTIVVYQPQPERISGNILSGRAAMSLELETRDEPIFGMFWFDAKIDTDADSGTALIRDVTVTDARWPDSTDANEQRLTAIVQAEVPPSGFEISLARLSASLDSAETELESLENLKNDPPRIVFSTELAVLLLYDGEARFKDVESSDYERVLNTPFAVVRDKRRGDLYLSSGVFWYEADQPLGPWMPTSSPPADLVRMMPEPEDSDSAPESPPAIIVATEPTELIVTVGPPDFQSLPGGELLYVRNTETPWLRELSTGNMYVLLSGRWYRSTSEAGPWTFVRADELPASFKEIPPASDIGGVRVSVADTDEADDAMLDAQIPQTAAIRRDQAMLTVSYDGAPQFEQIAGTTVQYAVNTAAQVLLIGGRYYAVDSGIWFTSQSAQGPWAVADSIPQDEIQQIPPSSPVYNTTYVHVYESTPEVVYVGYTPGYLWSLPYYGVPVYGTGWYYPPYWGSWYAPRPPTWGLHVGYNPWTGWNFGVSWSNGFFTVGMSWGGGWAGAPYRPWACCGGWYGGGYRRPVVLNTGDINIGNTVNIGNRTTVSNSIRNDRSFDLDSARTNIYNRSENRVRNADRTTVARTLRTARPAADGRANDVFADVSGNLARRTGDGWETHRNGQWMPDIAVAERAAPETRERLGAAQERDTPQIRGPRSIDVAGLDRSFQSRQHGARREAMLQRSRLRR